MKYVVSGAYTPAEHLCELARHAEAAGFEGVALSDHLVHPETLGTPYPYTQDGKPRWKPFTPWPDPWPAIAAMAAVTERLRVGSLVYDVDYRHPVVLAKSSATTQLLSGGRHEFGLGAGWMETDYREAGMPYDRIGTRIERLEEALQIIKGMWTQERTTFAGKHYQVQEIARAVEGLAPDQAPKLLIGGGGRRVLRLAGRHADIVGINPSLPEGRVTPDTARDLNPEGVRAKVEWVREGAERAGRDPGTIELNSLVFAVAIGDDPSGIRQALSGQTGMTPDEVADCPLFLTGSAGEIRERLEKRREQTGISYIVIQGDDPNRLEEFAEGIVAPLTGH